MLGRACDDEERGHEVEVEDSSEVAGVVRRGAYVENADPRLAWTEWCGQDKERAKMLMMERAAPVGT